MESRRGRASPGAGAVWGRLPGLPLVPAEVPGLPGDGILWGIGRCRMENTVRKIVYFQYCGEVNTDQVLHLAQRRCEELGISQVVIASETGQSALKAIKVFRGTQVRIIVVTHYPAKTWGPRGDIPIGLKRKEYANVLQELLTNDVRLVQGSRPFAPPSRSIEWDAQTPEGMIDKTLTVLGAGTKIAIEAAIMATDAGEVGEGEEIITCAGTFKGLDTALVVRPTCSMNFFKDFEVIEIVAKPRHRVRRLPEYEFENWRGDLEKYYHWRQSGAPN